MNIKNNPRIMRAWAAYDWANSVYSLVITSTIFPIYFSILTTAYEKHEYVAETGKWIKVPVRHLIKLFGREYQPDAIYGYSLTLSFLLLLFCLPFYRHWQILSVTRNRSCSFSVTSEPLPAWD